MRLLFSTFGSLGDLHPYIAVARAARVRGHEPIIATSAKYRTKIEAEDIGFRPIRPDLPEAAEFAPLAKRVMDGRTGPQYLFKELLSPTLRQNYADLVAASEDVDCIITHPAALGGPLAARMLKKMWLSSVLAPISLWSQHDPPVPPSLPLLEIMRAFGPLWGRTSLKFARQATQSWVREVWELSQEEGLPTSGHPIFEGSYSPIGTLALFSPHYGAPQADWPVNTTATGFCFFDKSGYAGQRSDEWREWVRDGEPPIVFTLGSSAVFDSEAFFRASSQLAVELGLRAIFLTGGTMRWDAPLPPSQLDVQYAAYSELFPLAHSIVHQGGIGTTAQALRAGVPQIIVPFAHDQPDNAARLRRLGVGSIVPRRRYERGGATEVLKRLMRNYAAYHQRAQALANLIQAENGPRAACEAIERLV